MQALPPPAADDIAGVLLGLVILACCLAVRCVIAGVRADLDTDQARDTVISDKQFAEELAELLRKEEHRD